MTIDHDKFDPSRRTLMRVAGTAALGVTAWALAAPSERAIDIVARKFEFLPGEIKVKQGETIVLRLTAAEVPMGFNLADFKLRADIVPGRVTTLRLTPDRVGRFVFVCDVFCGTGHEDMSGTLVVT